MHDPALPSAQVLAGPARRGATVTTPACTTTWLAGRSWRPGPWPIAAPVARLAQATRTEVSAPSPECPPFPATHQGTRLGRDRERADGPVDRCESPRW